MVPGVRGGVEGPQLAKVAVGRGGRARPALEPQNQRSSRGGLAARHVVQPVEQMRALAHRHVVVFLAAVAEALPT